MRTNDDDEILRAAEEIRGLLGGLLGDKDAKEVDGLLVRSSRGVPRVSRSPTRSSHSSVAMSRPVSGSRGGSPATKARTVTMARSLRPVRSARDRTGER